VVGGLLILSLRVVAQGAPSRIVGGHDAPDHKYPYQVSLQDPAIGHFCSGSIMNEHWILTAGHCFVNPNLGNYTISAGTNYLNVSSNVYMPQFSVTHEKFMSFQFYDIALIRIVGTIDFNEFIKPITLDDGEQIDYSLPPMMAGWGSQSVGGDSPNALQEIELKIITNEECKASRKYVCSSHICTFTNFGEGMCYGDSGGPLVVGGIQVGIASNVMPCAVGYADMFTRVSSYRDWIDKTIQRLEVI